MTDVSVVQLVLGGSAPLELDLLRLALAMRPAVGVAALAFGADEVLAKVTVHQPDVVLLCLDGPEWGGVRACAALKQLGSAPRVVVVGAPFDDVTLMAAVRAGADGYVTVSESVDDVLAVLRRVALGESSIPGGMLGALLRGLIEFRREDDEVVGRFAGLGNREREVLAALAAGLDHQAIAAKLHLSPHTARTHTQNIFAKLGVHSRLEAAQLVLDHDLLARFGLSEPEQSPAAR